jgi:hypothetical protein
MPIVRFSQQISVEWSQTYDPELEGTEWQFTFAQVAFRTRIYAGSCLVYNGTVKITAFLLGRLWAVWRVLLRVLWYTHCCLLQSALQPLVGLRPTQLPLSILSRKVLQSAFASDTSNPQLGGEPEFRAFQLSPQEDPSVWNDASEPSNGRWNYGREMAENFAESGDFHVTFGFFYMP